MTASALKWLASKLGALVLVELMLKGRDGIGRYAAQSLLVPAYGGYLRDDSPDAAVGCAEHQDMAAGVTGAPNSDPRCIDFGQRIPEKRSLAANRRSGARDRCRVERPHRSRRNCDGRGRARRNRSRRRRGRSARVHALSLPRSREPKRRQEASQVASTARTASHGRGRRHRRQIQRHGVQPLCCFPETGWGAACAWPSIHLAMLLTVS